MLKEGLPRGVDVLVALRDAIGKTTDSDQLRALAGSYAAAAAKLKEGDPRGADVFVALRIEIGKTTNRNQLYALAQGYAGVATKLKEGDPHSTDELAALRDAIGKTTDSDQLQALAQGYTTVATRAPSVTDISPPCETIRSFTSYLRMRRLFRQIVPVAGTICDTTEQNRGC